MQSYTSVDYPANTIQQMTVSGKATDSQTVEAMPGVNILVIGTSVGVITDASGRYSITVTDRNATLRFSFIGYVTLEVPLNGRSAVDVNLINEVTGLDEVVVKGYGTMRKSDLTGSVVSANIEAFNEIPNVNIMQSLQGVAPGVQIGQVNQAGQEPSIQIRGVNTLSGNDDP